ncbi:MAG TPA: non-homologous end-joining DNA ligase [Jatrophihabitans sp.]|nr:non-homologous end-joining DNA ligase [Jatrophihabitans sp.]
MFEGLSRAEREQLRESPLPTTVAAMLATLTEERFSRPDWIFERKFDGVRCLARRDQSGSVRLLSRNDQDLSRTYPEIAVAVSNQAEHEMITDGEVVAFEGRRTSFARLQGRLGISDPDAALATGIPVFYYVFDVVYLAGYDVRRLPLLTRKKLLRKAVKFADPLRFTTHRVGAGEEAFRAACARGDEGVIAKRAASPYTSGRSRDWLKFKCVRDQEFVIGGWTDPKGSRTGFGALLIGYYDGGVLVYAGKVGTGFDTAMLRRLSERLRQLEVPTSPFGRNQVRERDVHWARPELVAQIGFTEWTREGMLRHPRFLGLRTDKDPRDVVRESR